MSVLIVIPTYNERDNIRPLVDAIKKTIDADILFVDDSSPDGTGDLIEEMRKNDQGIFILHRVGKQGLGTAYTKGFAWGLDKGYDVLIQMDADGSHNPQYLVDFQKAIETNDVVIGSRYVHGGGISEWGWHRLLLSRWSNWYANTILRMKKNTYHIKDSTSGFRCWRATLLRQIDLGTIHSDGYSFQIETAWRAAKHGARIYETPIIFKDRTKGKSKISKGVIFESALLPWRLH